MSILSRHTWNYEDGSHLGLKLLGNILLKKSQFCIKVMQQIRITCVDYIKALGLVRFWINLIENIRQAF